jgi:hypothetical protein
MMYLRTGGLPNDKDKPEQLHCLTGHYTLVNDEMFQRSANGTLMRCILLEEGCSILQDIHSGICGSHVGAVCLWVRSISRGFTSPRSFLPTQVPRAAGYDPKLWIQSIPSSSKWLGNHTPHTRERPHHSRLKRRGHQPKKN